MSDKQELFIEIGAEEIPAKEVMVAVHALRDELLKGLDERRLSHGEARVYATPRRLAVAIAGVDVRQTDLDKEVAGPPVRAGIKDGKPTPAAEGFARGLGLKAEDLFQKETPKGAYLYARVLEKGKASVTLLPELITAVIGKLPFKRTMRWGAGDVAFSRPVQWIVALLGGEVVRLSFADVESGRKSFGHRFMAPEPFEVSSAASWLAELEKRQVIADVPARRRLIVEGATRLAESIGGHIRPDEELIDEVTQLVEKPIPLLGEFDASYLKIPQEVLISEMREHQRYLSVVDAGGKLMPYFVVIGNTQVRDPKVPMNGYRRVLSSRFADGIFFYTEDQKTRLADRIDRLKEVAFHRALGTTYEKVERAVKLAFYFAGALGEQLGVPGISSALLAPSDLRKLADAPEPKDTSERWKWQLARAGWLAKADLTTRMVFEFPELQGVMGRAYAHLGGEPEDVARAIEDHYLPRNANDAMPATVIGALLGLGDRLDTIVGIFATGKGPTGTADPFGLRRAALGILNVLRARGWHVSLEAAIKEAIALLGAKKKKDEPAILEEVADFFRGRLKGVITAQDVPGDVAEAALGAGCDDLVDAGLRAEALARLRKTDEFVPVAITFKRVANILKDQSPGAVDAASLEEPIERRLLEVTVAVEAKVQRALAARDFAAAVGAIGEIRPVVDQFFTDVMVMDENPARRQRRVALVARVHRIFAPLADFTRLN